MKRVYEPGDPCWYVHEDENGRRLSPGLVVSELAPTVTGIGIRTYRIMVLDDTVFTQRHTVTRDVFHMSDEEDKMPAYVKGADPKTIYRRPHVN